MKRLILLGSTGSIGRQTLDIVKDNKDKFQVAGLSCNHNINLLREQIIEFQPYAVCIGNEEQARRLRQEFKDLVILSGDKGLREIVKVDADMVVNALVGICGLAPTYDAVMAGKDIALANKETLVAGGELITEAVKNKKVNLYPIDSEHSAIFQCLESRLGSDVDKIILTASGGPFRGFSLDELERVSLDEALNHPKWNMGKKITIDSATMMNKGLEVIEARWLFNVPASKIEVHVHPESVVHSAVEFSDGSVISQMGVPDMRIPISLALNYPKRLDLDVERLNLFEVGNLHFEKPDRNVFTCLDQAYKALEKGGVQTAALNGANEELVSMFLRGDIGYLDIQRTLEKIMDEDYTKPANTVEEILEIDEAARRKARGLVKNIKC